MGPQLTTAGATQPGTLRPLSTTHAASAVEANPQDRPCNKRPIKSGVALCTCSNENIATAENNSEISETLRLPK
uniref:Uncharacterized protein n=1 Tax=Escherichia coli TaxID=562 RepID=I3VZX2_ECOLX|nr:hypothetical protein [Escherichia coli]